MKKPAIAFLAVLALIAIAVIFRPDGDGQPPAASPPAPASKHQATAPAPDSLPSSGENKGSAPGKAVAANDSNTPTGPATTKAKRRDTAVSPDGIRRSIIDPMALWPEQPAWPEGPRLFAEVDTTSRRYVNLRPDDAGEMPRIRAEAEERIELRVNFPEGEPGEKIHVEIPNGGSFADTKARGRVLILPENLTLSFPYITDDSRGHCNVKLRHRGHTRSLPVWVGELPAS